MYPKARVGRAFSLAVPAQEVPFPARLVCSCPRPCSPSPRRRWCQPSHSRSYSFCRVSPSQIALSAESSHARTLFSSLRDDHRWLSSPRELFPSCFSAPRPAHVPWPVWSNLARHRPAVCHLVGYSPELPFSAVLTPWSQEALLQAEARHPLGGKT